MKKLVKILLGLALALVVLVGAAALVAPMLIDPNDYRDEIAAAVESRTGRKLTIEGDIKLTLLPWVGVDLGRVTLGNASGFDAPHFAEVGRLQIRVKALPLLSRSVEMDTARVEGLKLNLARNAKGETNWDDLAGAADTSTPASSEPPPYAALALGGVELENAEVSWHDAVTGQTVRIASLALSTGALALDRPVPVTTRFDLASTAPDLNGEVKLDAAVTIGADGRRLTVKGLGTAISLRGADLPGGKADLAFSADAAFDQDAGKLTLTSIEAKVDGLEFSGLRPTVALTGALDADLGKQVFTASDLNVATTLRGDSIPGGQIDATLTGTGRFDAASGQVSAGGLELRVPSLALDGARGDAVVRTDLAADVNAGKYVLKGLIAKGELSGEKVLGGTLVYDVTADVTADAQTERFRALGLRAGGSLSGGDTPGKELPFAVAGDLLLDRRADTLTLEGFKLSAADLKASGKLVASALSGSPRLAGTLDIPTFNPRKVATLAGQKLPAMRDEKSLASLAIKTEFDATADSLKLDSLVLVVDGQTIKGSAALPSIAARSLRFDLTADAFDADRYLPPEAKGGAKASPATAGAAAAGLPLETLRGLDVEGRLKIAKLKINRIDLARVDAGVKASKGLIDISPLSARLYGGSYRGHTVIDARGKQATVSVDEKIKGVRADRLLAGLGVKTGNLDLSGGASSMSLAAKASGDTTTGLYRFDALKLNANVAGKSFPGGRLKAGLGADVKVNLQKNTLSADKLLVVFGELVAKGTLDVTGLTGDAPRYNARLDVPNFNPRTVMKHLGRPAPRTADPKAFTRASLTTNASGSLRAIKLDKLDLSLDGSKLKGNVDLKNLDPLVLDFDLDVDRLDLDAYAPPKSRAQAATPGAVATAVPVELLRYLQANGALRVARLKVGGLSMSNVVLTAKAKDGQVKLHPLGARLYGGAYEGNVQIDATGKAPAFVFSEKLDAVQVGDLLADLGKPQTAAGTLTARMDLKTSGADSNALLARLGGSVNFALERGAIGGIDIYQTICSQLDAQLPKISAATRGLKSLGSGGKLDLGSLLGGVIAGAASGQKSTAAAVAGRGYTPFDRVSASFAVQDGRASNRDFALSAPDLRVNGSGIYAIPSNYMDFTAAASLVRGCVAGEGRARYAALAGKALPVQIKGTPPEIDINPKFDAIIEASLPALIAESDAAEREQARQDQTTAQPQQPAQAPQKKDLGQELLKGILGGKGIGGLLSQ